MTPKHVAVDDPEAAADALAKPPTAVQPAAEPATTEQPTADPGGSSTAAAAPSQAAPTGPELDTRPRLADGIDLIGEFAGSGVKTPPFIARRSDGQVVQMPERLFRLAEAIDGESDLAQIADRFSRVIKRQVGPDDVGMLIDSQLRPLGIVAAPAGEDDVALNKVDPLLALKFRAAVVPERAVYAITTVFRPLFLPPVMIVAVLAFLGLDGWLFFVHGIGQSLRHVLEDPVLTLLLIAGVFLATAFHEIGHATACRYGGAKPGVMGVGIYLVWPAFYTDITDAYRLPKAGRLRADIGGIYFNAIFALAVGGAYFATGFEPLLLLVVLGTFEIVQQALPFLRLDGYYILSDLTGVPDVYRRIRPVLASFIPGRPADPSVTELKTRVRVAVTIYVVLITIALALMGLAIVINLPRIVSTGYTSAASHWAQIGPAIQHGRPASAVLDVIQTVFLILPAVGLAYSLLRFAQRAVMNASRWSSGRPRRQLILAAGGAAGIAVAALSWWPNGDYKPIYPRERGTLLGLLKELESLPTARPSLTRQAEASFTEPIQTPTGRSAPGQRTGGRAASARGKHAKGTARHRGRTTTPSSSTTTTSGGSTTTSTSPAAPTATGTPGGGGAAATTTGTTSVGVTTPTSTGNSTSSTRPTGTTSTQTTP